MTRMFFGMKVRWYCAFGLLLLPVGQDAVIGAPLAVRLAVFARLRREDADRLRVGASRSWSCLRGISS
jgi:hypothetical protein